MKCHVCNTEFDGNFCPNCGKAFNNASVQKRESQSDSAGVYFYAIVGFILPIIGIIEFIYYKKDNPKLAKVTLIAAILGLLFALVTYIIPMFSMLSWIY